jgi:hypothetical protein
MQCAAPVVRPTLALPFGLKATAYGLDFGWGGPSVGFLRSQGVRFAASYLSYDASKNWQAAQVRAYHAAGIATVAVWETAAERALGGYWAGVSDARAAATQARALGEPANRPIYFAVDFDSSPNPSAILPYFQGADSVLGPSRVGAGYGGIATIRALFAHRLVRYGWQTSAWSGGIWDPRAQIEQYAYSQSFDRDRATASDYGQWPYTAPKPHVGPSPQLRKLYRLRRELNGDLERHACRRVHGRRAYKLCPRWGREWRRVEAQIKAAA